MVLTLETRGRSGRNGRNGSDWINGEASGRSGIGTDRFIEWEASRHGTVGEEGEELEAELSVGFDPRGTVLDVGNVLDSHGIHG